MLPRIEITELSLDNIDDIVRDENCCFPPSMRASNELIKDRFSFGHIMLGVVVDGELSGKICFSYANFSPDYRTGFPQTFTEFSTRPIEPAHNAAFVYNLNVQPKHRRHACARKLVQALLSRIKLDGCSYVVLDGRPASYAGDETEGIERCPEVATAIDRYLYGGPFPTDRQLCMDPLLAFFWRLGGQFLWIIPGFIPADTATCGLRVIMYKEIG